MNKTSRAHTGTHNCSCGACSLEQTSNPTSFFSFFWERKESRVALLGALIGLPSIVISELTTFEHPVLDISAFIAILLAGYPVFRNAWNTVFVDHNINANVLMAIAAIGAIFISAFQEAAAVMLLFALGETLEDYASSRSRQSIRSLMEVIPTVALHLYQKEGRIVEESMPVEKLHVGDIILVKPGERIPMDGRVIKGRSSVNQAPITGESKPVEKNPESSVFASSINGEGSLEIEVTHVASDNTISRLIQMVEESQERRAPVQRVIDRFARFYTPLIVILAALVAIIPPLFFQQPFFNPVPGQSGWLYRGLSILVIGCPCALVIGMPVAIISAITNAAQHGVIVKGGAYLEELSHMKAMAFDKTGTLTNGRPSVIAIRSMLDHTSHGYMEADCPNCDELVALAYAVERHSEHPLAHAIHLESERRGVRNNFPAAESVTAHSGKGVSGQVNGKEVVIANHAFFDEHIPHNDIHCEAARLDANNGYTPLMVSNGESYVGTITVTDNIRAGSAETLQRLRKMGVEHLMMLSGDQPEIARQIGEKVGIQEVYAGLLPAEKVSLVKNLQQRYGTVAMVGDGINDAPALASSNIGIAVGAAMGGSGQAMETADIALMGNTIEQLPFILKLSKKTVQTIWASIIFALGIKLAFLLLVFLGYGTMWMAVFADTGTTLLVSLNGMRLLQLK